MTKKSLILGIDIGGTKIAAGLVDFRGKIQDIRVFPTPKYNLIGQLFEIIEKYSGFDGIGLGFPGQVKQTGEVVYLPNIRNFKATNFRLLLEKRYKVPVAVNNDADCFAYSEAMIGQGRNKQSVAGIILGTGIGLGIVINKGIFPGYDGVAGEIGRFPMLDGKTLEDHVRFASPFKNASQARKYLKLILNYTILGINPGVIILGGAWSKLKGMEQVCSGLVRQIEEYKIKTPVKISKLEHAGLIGAALLVLKK
jgi:predicted NBD/HSP70 family sugar kinase